MRPSILKALLRKEVDRHLANRGGLALGGLLVVSALLLSVFNPTVAGAPNGPAPADAGGEGLIGGVHGCYVDLLQDTPVTRYVYEYLKDHRPPALRPKLLLRERRPGGTDALLTYPPGTGAIQLRSTHDADGREVVLFEVWHPPDAPGGMWPYEQWFWAESVNALEAYAAAAGAGPQNFTRPDLGDDLWVVRETYRRLGASTAGNGRDSPLPRVEVRRQGLGGKPLSLRDAIATGMAVFALYFACVYLLSTLTCEERERDVLLAQALSPASPAEILAAKFLFYPLLGAGLAALIAGIYKPSALAAPFFWLSIVGVAGAFLGIGMTVASLATTQRAAFLGSMCYLMSVALLMMICQQNGIPGLPLLAVEYHGPRVLHAAVTGEPLRASHWFHLAAVWALAAAWLTAANRLFRRRGWQ